MVAIGGGHGLSATLRAARRVAGELTAVVSVADDGGSTGRLRAIQDRAAPGDLRKCVVALAAEGSLLAGVLNHRFEAGDLGGHALGNLLIAALEESANDLVAALDELGRAVGAVGRVLPSTTTAVRLVGQTDDGRTVEGQTELMATRGLQTVSLVPASAEPPAAVLDAIAEADLVVLGPGSLYTSVLAAVAVPAVGDAVRDVIDRTVYVCNLQGQPGETEGYAVSDHRAALERHGLQPAVWLVDPGCWDDDDLGADVIAAPMTTDRTTHDPELLAAALNQAWGRLR